MVRCLLVAVATGAAGKWGRYCVKIKTFIASAMIVGSGLFVVPGMARAALQDCATDHMCMWANNNYGVMIGDRPHNQSNVVNLGSSENDRMDSWANRSAQYAGPSDHVEKRQRRQREPGEQRRGHLLAHGERLLNCPMP
jgi:hypothetical protein